MGFGPVWTSAQDVQQLKRRRVDDDVTLQELSRERHRLRGLKYMGGSINRGYPKWLVYNGKSYYIKWMIWGHPYFRKPQCAYIIYIGLIEDLQVAKW